MAKKTVNTHPTQKSRLLEMRDRLTAEQKHLLNLFWNSFQQSGEWPTTRIIHSRHGGKEKIQDCLRGLSGDVVFENENHSPGHAYQLTFIGILLTDDGDNHVKLISRYLEFLRKQYQNQPETLNFSDAEILKDINLTKEHAELLGKLIELSNFLGFHFKGKDSWGICAPDFIEDLPSEGSLDAAFEKLAFRHFEANKPVFVEERWKQRPATVFAPAIGNVYTDISTNSSSAPVTVDALKRRYQVFVSSTYEDLKDERQSVIHALLESKCIPTGMELFPAASMEQWQLIQKIIQECDYYIVIVAGRYGSISEAGIGFTEMEFDYACELGKPVIGFYHRNPKSLPGTKLEDNDIGKKRLAAFTEKVKSRLCRAWSSPAELGSAVKSAIFSELELTPRPGWIRADAVPNSEAVERMKQRIADLEEKLKQKKFSIKAVASDKPALPDGDHLIEIPVTISYDFQKVKAENYDYLLSGIDHYENLPQKTIEESIQISWDDIVLLLSNDLQSGSKLSDLRYRLTRNCTKIGTLVTKHLGKPSPKHECSLSQSKVELLLKTLMAKKLVKMVADYGNYSDPFWQFTPKGFQYLAELQAIRSPA